MALTCAQMIDRVLQRVGRKYTSSQFQLNEVVLDALNEAQRKIVRRCPHPLELQVKDDTYCKVVTSHYEYDLSDIDPPMAHLQAVWILNGLESHEVTFKNKRKFDSAYPDVSAVAAALPTYYTRRGHTLVFSCPFSSDYDGLAIRLDYCQWASEFEAVTSEETSDIENSDTGLMHWAEAESLKAIARGNATVLAIAKQKERDFDDWLTEFQSYHSVQTEETTGEGYHVLDYEEN
jgi:hypothetical protein